MPLSSRHRGICEVVRTAVATSSKAFCRVLQVYRFTFCSDSPFTTRRTRRSSSAHPFSARRQSNPRAVLHVHWNSHSKPISRASTSLKFRLCGPSVHKELRVSLSSVGLVRIFIGIFGAFSATGLETVEKVH